MEAQATNIDFSQLLQQLLTLLSDPASNLTAAFVLYGIITLVLLLVIVVALILIDSTPEDEEEAEYAAEYAAEQERAAEVESARAAIESAAPGEVVEGLPESGVGASAQSAKARARAVQAPRVKVVRSPKARLLSALIGVGVLLAVWLVAGVSTSSSAVCEGCHVLTPHVAADSGVTDPHKGRACVTCHEPGGVTARYLSAVPTRLLHFIDGSMQANTQTGYGTVTQSACSSCHERGIADVTLNADRGLRMSHTEPLAASMRCLGCHVPEDGVVGGHNAGMNPCLACHDSKTASAECETCHDKKAAAAARGRATSMASPQIKEVTCGGCHDEKKECDTCHGLRMPHSVTFRAYAHARAGAVDFWYNNGKTCAKCHTAERRSCQKCHTAMLGEGHGPSLAVDHRTADEEACDRCHQTMQFQRNRNFCTDVCHTPAAEAQSPR